MMMKKKPGRQRLIGLGLSALVLAAMMPLHVLQANAEEAFAAETAGTEMAGTESFAPDGQLPQRYDLREQGRAPSVKDQGAYATCWSLVAVSALESALLPEEDTAFSADHMTLQNGFAAGPEDGGDYRMIMAYLGGWTGPVLSAEDPYGDGVSPEGLEAAAHVQEMRLLTEQDPEAVKRMVMRFGAMQTSLFLNRESVREEAGYYDAGHCAYYCPEKKKNEHDVLVIGWDDAFPKEWFAQQPDRDGAYICQNSWGEDFGEKGIFYVSYADANICGGGLVFTDVDTAGRYDGIYQTDPCGWQGQQGYGDEGCYFANVYTAQRDETLEAAGFYATGPDSYYEVCLVRDFTGPEDFDNKELLVRGVLEEAGYYTVPFDEPPLLQEGERFALAVFIETPGAKNPAAVEYRKDTYTETVTTEGKEGYLSFAGTAWENTEEKYGTNVCLKAYTCGAEEETKADRENEGE